MGMDANSSREKTDIAKAMEELESHWLSCSFLKCEDPNLLQMISHFSLLTNGDGSIFV